MPPGKHTRLRSPVLVQYGRRTDAQQASHKMSGASGDKLSGLKVAVDVGGLASSSLLALRRASVSYVSTPQVTPFTGSHVALGHVVQVDSIVQGRTTQHEKTLCCLQKGYRTCLTYSLAKSDPGSSGPLRHQISAGSFRPFADMLLDVLHKLFDADYGVYAGLRKRRWTYFFNSAQVKRTILPSSIVLCAILSSWHHLQQLHRIAVQVHNPVISPTRGCMHGPSACPDSHEAIGRYASSMDTGGFFLRMVQRCPT